MTMGYDWQGETGLPTLPPQGPNVGRLVAKRIALLIGDAGALTTVLRTPGRLMAIACEADLWVAAVLELARQAPGCPYGHEPSAESDERIAADILAKIDDGERAGLMARAPGPVRDSKVWRIDSGGTVP